ncbi:MAG: F0F1 ATP synthase subunit B [Egibacteraceae bacterium]
MAMLATVVLLAAEGGGENPAQLLLPDQAELIWGLIGFALLMFVMVRKVFPALNKTLEERQQAIQGRLEQAEAARQDAEQLRREYEEKLADAREQATKIIEDTRTQAEGLRADLIRRAEEEARQIVERARADQQAERSRLIQDLRGQVADLSLSIASKIVQQELDGGRHADLVDDYINQLSSLN